MLMTMKVITGIGLIICIGGSTFAKEQFFLPMLKSIVLKYNVEILIISSDRAVKAFEIKTLFENAIPILHSNLGGMYDLIEDKCSKFKKEENVADVTSLMQHPWRNLRRSLVSWSIPTSENDTIQMISFLNRLIPFLAW